MRDFALFAMDTLQTQWARVQMFLVFNTFALPLVFGTGQIEKVKLLINLVGLTIHVVLLNATLRADGWIKYLDDKMAEFEKLDQEDTNGVRVAIFSGADFQSIRNGKFASRRLFGAIGILVSFLWLEETVRYTLFFLKH